jgi:hypothetical protein
MNGFELCEKMLIIDINVRVCFMSSGEINLEALREIYPTLSLGCFIKKPVTIDYLVKRIRQNWIRHLALPKTKRNHRCLIYIHVIVISMNIRLTRLALLESSVWFV